MFFYYILKIPRSLIIRMYIYWNRIKFKINNIKLGKNSIITGGIYTLIDRKGKVIIGDNFTFSSGHSINPLSRNIKGVIRCTDNATIKIGNNVGLSSTCVWAHNSITIGNNVNIGGDCLIIDSDAHSLNYIDRRNIKTDQLNRKDKPIIIDDDVLIGTRCIILKGVTIGARSIIGAGSVVTKSIPADCIAAGNPCQILKEINK